MSDSAVELLDAILQTGLSRQQLMQLVWREDAGIFSCSARADGILEAGHKRELLILAPCDAFDVAEE
jgi:hypothetical protein